MKKKHGTDREEANGTEQVGPFRRRYPRAERRGERRLRRPNVQILLVGRSGMKAEYTIATGLRMVLLQPGKIVRKDEDRRHKGSFCTRERTSE